MEPIETRNLGKSYGKFRAVESLDLSIRRGEIVGFLGPNGAGKSTTIKMLVGLARPTSGEAWINGFNIATHPLEGRRSLGYLPEVVGVYGDMTGRQFLRYSGRFYEFSESALTRRVEELLAVVKIEHAASRKLKTYSKGMRQRAALAAALIHDPDVVILDEPLTGLDPVGVIEMREAIKKLGESKTVFLSSHELHAVEALCDRVIIVKDGRVLADARVEDLVRGETPRVRVRLASARSGFVDEARKTTGVAFAESLSAAGGLDFRLVLEDGVDTSALLRDLVSAGVPVAEFAPERESLEDAFIRISGVRRV